MYSVVFFSDSDQGACHKYRVLHPVKALKNLGVRAEYRASWTPDCQDFDVFFFQRNSTKDAISILYQLSKKKCNVVYDIDDDIFHIPEDNPVYNLYLNSPSVPWHQVQGLVLSSKVSVSCRSLMQLYEHFNDDVRVLPNCVDPDNWENVNPILVSSDAVRIFWGGSPTHKNDLTLIIPVMKELKRLYKDSIEFIIMGQDMEFGCDVTQIPAGSYEFFQRVMVSCDIGLAPMVDNAFNRGKSDLRLKELGCAGLAAVASRVGQYDLPIIDTAEKARGWVDALSRLIEDVSYRNEKAQQLHDWAYTYLINDHIHKWDDMFKEMVNVTSTGGSFGQGFTVHNQYRPSLEIGGGRVRVGSSTSSKR